jgi:uncharacterized membrane protein YebE (DUF533 family)
MTASVVIPAPITKGVNMDPLKLLGSLLGNNATSSGQGGQILGQLLGSLTGGGAQSGGAGGGGLADLLGGLTRGGAHGGGAGGGGLADLLGGLTGGVRPQGGAALGGSNLPSLLGGLAMAALQMFGQRGAAAGQASFATLAGVAAEQAPPVAVNTAQAHQQALAFIKAMLNAAKADGQIDAEEQQKIVSKLGDVGPQEAAFIREEMAKPLNFDFFADITQDMAPQVYAVSLMAINLDTPAESSYMQQLAQGLGLDAQTVNGIHAQLGLAPLYS